MLPNDPRHGTYAGARRHRVLDIPICDPCKMAAARYQNMREYDRITGKPRAVSALGARRRIQGLVCLGYSYRELAPHLGVSPAQVHKWATHDQAFIRAASLERIAAVCIKLGMTPAPTSRNAAYARTVARRNKWEPLFSWDDIDNDLAPVTTAADTAHYRVEDLLSEWHWLRTAGESIDQAARQLGVTVGAIEKAIERAGKAVA